MIYTGLCCQNTELVKQGIRCSRTCRQSNFTTEKAIELGRQNLQDCINMMHWNYEHNIHSFRLSSDMLPHYSNPNVPYYDMKHFDDLFSQIGELSKKYQQRITFHPDQFNVLSSPDKHVVDSTYRDLLYHAEMLEHMNIEPEFGVINIHGGGVYGDKESAIRRWVDNFDDLPHIVKQYLTVENDEHSYSANDCIDIATQCNIPVVFDTHHHECYHILHPYEQIEPIEPILEQISELFEKNNKKHLFHISSQRENSRIGSHSDYITAIPEYLHNLAIEKQIIYVDVEAKMKEQAIMELRTRYDYVL